MPKTRWLPLGLGLALAAPLGAQQADSATTAPDAAPRADSVPTLVYSVNRSPEQPFQTGRDVTVITQQQIARRDPRTLPELLGEHGVYLRQSSYSNSRVYLRGFNGKELLVLVDGVQANNAVSTFDLNLIDVRMVERVEIVQGVGSVLGSEALGGIINIVTKQGPAVGETGALNTRAVTRMATNSTNGYGEVSGSTERFRYRLGGVYSKNRDVQAGGEAGVQQYTGYVDRGASGSAEFEATSERTLSASFRTHAIVDAPRRSRYTGGRYSHWVEPMEQHAASVRLTDMTEYRWATTTNLTAYGDRASLARNYTSIAAPTVRAGDLSRDDRMGMTLEMLKIVGSSHRVIYGTDLSLETITSFTEDTAATGEVVRTRGRYTDGATFRRIAAYAQDRIDLGSRLVTTVGIRGASFVSSGSETTPDGQFDIGASNAAVTTSLNALYRVSQSLHLVAGVVDGFRAPDIEDLSTLTVRSATFEIPSPGLKPAKVRTFEGGMKYSAHGLSGSLFYQANRTTRVIKQAPGTYLGLSFLDENGNGTQDAGEPDIEQRQNLGKLTVNGATAALSYAPTASLRLSGNYQLMVGRDRTEGTYMAEMPPAFGTVHALWTPALRMQPWMEVAYQTARSQQRLNPEDVDDDFIGADGTAGYDVVSLRMGARLFSQLRVRAAVENLTNKAYLTHGSQVQRPGREVVVGAEVGF